MLKIDALKKDYPGFSLDVSFEIPAGRVTGLIGRNGSGKSTIFKAILDLIKKDGGQVFYQGRDISSLGAREKEEFGLVLAESIFSDYLTLGQVKNILRGLYGNFDEGVFTRLVSQMDLPLDKKIKDFSTGMKAKAKLLSALSHRSKFLLLDEPTSGLDVIAREEVLDFIRDYLEENPQASVLISSHIASDIESLCDDIYLIEKGKIIFHEDTDRVLSDYGLIKVREEEFAGLAKDYIVKYKKEAFGYKLLTNEKAFYVENYPRLVVEKANIDDLITIMDKGEDL